MLDISRPSLLNQRLFFRILDVSGKVREILYRIDFVIYTQMHESDREIKTSRFGQVFGDLESEI